MEKRKLIRDIQESVLEIYNEHDLECLRGLKSEDEFILNGRQIILWYSEITQKSTLKHQHSYDYLKNFDDLIFLSDEILYFTAHLYLYKDFINDPIEAGFIFYDRMVYPNNQNLEAKRFNMYADVVSESVYKYWDRIGDLIASFFPGRLEEHKVYFGTALDLIPTELRDSENYKWLINFKEGEYRELNKIRKNVAHYISSDTQFKYAHLNSSGDREQIETILREKRALPDVYKEHIKTTLEGFGRTLLLLDEVAAKTFQQESQL
ncbi:MAG: Cthe_2314 family HEPN domain-containing protein [Bacteroidota bacterium]